MIISNTTRKFTSRTNKTILSINMSHLLPSFGYTKYSHQFAVRELYQHGSDDTIDLADSLTACSCWVWVQHHRQLRLQERHSAGKNRLSWFNLFKLRQRMPHFDVVIHVIYLYPLASIILPT